MGNEHEVLWLIRDGIKVLVDGVEIVTENDMEIYIDDYVFRVHVEGDLAE